MSWKFIATRILLRDAPYIDMDEFREKVIRKCESSLTVFPEGSHSAEQFQKYKDGVSPVLPYFEEVRRAIRQIFGEYPEAMDDIRRDDALRTLRRYFFDPGYWEES